jgi:LysR family hydrogen peroxide-inducible transcriptional activator
LLVRPGADEGAPVPNSETLCEMNLLLLEEGHCFRDQALAFCNLQTAPRRDTLDANSLSTLVQMVGAGLGVTLIPEMALALETRSASVCVSRLKDPQPSRTVGMVWRKANPLAGQFLQLSEVVCRSADSLRAQETLQGPSTSHRRETSGRQETRRGRSRKRNINPVSL